MNAPTKVLFLDIDRQERKRQQVRESTARRRARARGENVPLRKKGAPKGFKFDASVVERRAATQANNSDRFWKKVAKGANDECWPWTGCTNEWGYGGTYLLGTPCLAHRKAWILTNGPIRDELLILHSCDNPPCCNPEHLRPGTNAENMSDMSKRMRARFSTLTPEQVNAALDRIEAGERSGVICDELGISRSALHHWMNKLNRRVGPKMRKVK